MTWISPGRSTFLSNTASAYGAVGNGSSHPLSGFFSSLGAAQAAYPNANVTSLTQEIDACALLQLDHDFRGRERILDGGPYLVDQMITFGATGAGQGGVVRGTGGAASGNGTVIRAKAGSGLTAVVALDANSCSYQDFTADANNYTLGGAVTAISTGTGATNAIWYRNCALSRMSNLGAAGYKQFGHWQDTSTGGISDGVKIDNGCVVTGGTAEVQSLTCTATSGNFTITVTNYLGTQTTGNIAFNAPGSTVVSALNALTTVNPSGDGGAPPSGTAQCFSNSSTYLPANTQGPLGTNPVYLIFTGALMGPQNLLTLNQGTLAGGAVSITRIQAGLVSAGFGWGAGADNNIVQLDKPRASGQFGDCILFNGGVNHAVFSPDLENNFCAGIRWSGCDSSPATVLTGNTCYWPYAENCWQSYYIDTRITSGTIQQGGILMRTNRSGTGSLKVQSGQASQIIDMAIDNATIVINGTVLTVP